MSNFVGAPHAADISNFQLSTEHFTKIIQTAISGHLESASKTSNKEIQYA
jgi:hypothetical protein